MGRHQGRHVPGQLAQQRVQQGVVAEVVFAVVAAEQGDWALLDWLGHTTTKGRPEASHRLARLSAPWWSLPTLP
jgi:hypothetical protein